MWVECCILYINTKGTIPFPVRYGETQSSSDMTSRQPEPTHASRKKYYSYASVVSLRSACDLLLRCVGHTKATKASATIGRYLVSKGSVTIKFQVE